MDSYSAIVYGRGAISSVDGFLAEATKSGLVGVGSSDSRVDCSFLSRTIGFSIYRNRECGVAALSLAVVAWMLVGSRPGSLQLPLKELRVP